MGLLLAAVAIALATLAGIFFFLLQEGLPALRLSLLLNPTSIRNPEAAGILVPLISSLWIVGLTMLVSLPMGVGAGIYMQEYAGRSRLAQALQTGVANLAGVPSVVFGLLGLGLFVQLLGMGSTVLVGALILSLLVFPYVVIATQEALRAVPQSIRDASLALGATRWQTIRRHVLPAASPGVFTGAILAASRAFGETAPLLVITAAVLQYFIPTSPFEVFAALPVVIYAWAIQPEAAAGLSFRQVAAAASVVFLGMILLLNLTAVVLRQRFQARW